MGAGGPSVHPKKTAAEWRQFLATHPGNDSLIKAEDILPDPANPPPDATDDLVQRARLAMLRRQMMGSGLNSTFLTGSFGDPSAPPTSKPSAGGY